MPSFEDYVADVPQVVRFDEALAEALGHAQVVKPASSVEPALTKPDFALLFSQLPTIFPDSSAQDPGADGAQKARQFLAVETVMRRRFDTLLASTPIQAPEFVEVWNILDVVTALAESEQCDSSLPFQLIEVLIDSQTIQGCHIVFDYLESRRERLVKDWTKNKSMVILRTCNELLRRLSRAEDISFSGRVFIFMFQSFPMGDKGTVNLRGIYHTENVTTWEEIPPKSELEAADSMEVDTKEEATPKPVSTGTKAVSFDAKDKAAPEKALGPDALYPIFWSMQQYYSQPTKLFDSENMAKFKSGLEATVAAFDSVAQGQRTSKAPDETKDPSKKRKRLDVETSDSSNFNPKYLTSRDLFELEMSDLFFRRHILIQAIIVLDFLRSLTAAAKAKSATIQHPNKSVMYHDKTTSEEDDKWAEAMRNRIYEYIWAGPDGQYVHRIIQAVTQRDKGWSRWKQETCPNIERPAVTPDAFNEAKASAKRMATNKRLRPHPMASLSLDFLKVEDEETAMGKFKDAARWKLPELASFKDKISEDDLELDFAKSEKEKTHIIEAKASKTWRALRIASRSRLAAFDKIDDWQDISAVFADPNAPGVKEEDEEEGEVGRKPEDTLPIIISGPTGVGKSALIAMLQEKQPRVFQKLLQHTTRQPNEGEIDGQDYHFVDSATFNRMSDNDQIAFMSSKEDVDFGISNKLAGSIQEAGKVPILELDHESVLSAKEWDYKARVVLISPPTIEELETRLKSSGKHAGDTIPDLLKAAQEEGEKWKANHSLYSIEITNGDQDRAYKALEEFIYGSATETNGINGESTAKEDDVTMDDAGVEMNGEAKPETNGS
ncbi:uncharacterized protein JN550_000258 [Neoarthrinium moseri]|uniref:uncharacterized protein n=1 Tax=Neoarthrinium moseri TaxID=1658444 RepID=UPI001FDAFAB6|nr:uncharacterized protein JN550_000258 [Neoarthrinium moseri]KAI1878076.1 hypothetical protein JN550_000258 [Neoarthrinium moseri]